MTMHLLGPAFSTIATHRKSKNSKVDRKKMAVDWRDYNKQMKRLGCSLKTFDEYLQYRQGKYNPKLRGVGMPDYNVSNHRAKYPSGDGIGTTYARKENVYTGTLIKGIATMHKSNAVPIINNEQAIEVATMRRG